MIHKVGLLQESRWLFSRATNQQRSSPFMQAMGKSFDCMETCRIQRSHVTQTENYCRIEFIQISGRFHQLFCRAEQECPVNAKDRRVGGNLLVLKDMGDAFVEIFVSNGRDRSRFRNTADIKVPGKQRKALRRVLPVARNWASGAAASKIPSRVMA